MSRDFYNHPTVPHYAAPATKPLRPRAPNEIPDWLQDKKILQSKIYQAIYNWIRANWKEGDAFFMGEGAPAQNNYYLLNRYGRFKTLRPMGATSCVVVDWLDDGHKIHIQPTIFYRCARKLNNQGEEIEVSRIEWQS